MATTQGTVLHRTGAAAPADEFGSRATVDVVIYAVGRALLALIFVLSGFAKIIGFSDNVAYMQANGFTTATAFFLVGAIIVEVVGGIALMFGLFTRWAALSLAVYTVVAALIFHDFWSFEGAEAMMQQAHFLKNLAIAGGLFGFSVFAQGKFDK